MDQPSRPTSADEVDLDADEFNWILPHKEGTKASWTKSRIALAAAAAT